MKELINKYLKYLKIERNSSRHTITSYQNDLIQLLHFASEHLNAKPESLKISEIDRLIIRLWIWELSENGMMRNTIARKVAAVRSFFKYCYKKGFIEKNPAHLLIIPKKEERLPKTLQINEVKEMMDLAAGNAPETIQERAILEMFYATGIRLSELTNLKIKDIQLNQNQLTVTGKGSKQRIVPLGKKAKKAIQTHLKNRSQLLTENSSIPAKESLFLSANGEPVYPRMVQRIIRKYLLKVSEVTQKSPHTLRHSFATHMLDAGADIRLIKEFLGHSNLSSTQVYTHTSVERLQKIYSQAHPRAENKS